MTPRENAILIHELEIRLERLNGEQEDYMAALADIMNEANLVEASLGLARVVAQADLDGD